jgi:hypothetical protein
VVTIGIQAFVEMIRGIVEMFRRLPPAARLILGTVLAALILHPASRERIQEWTEILWERLREAKPVLASLSTELVKHLTDAAQTSQATGNEIKSKLRPQETQTALSHLRLICLRSKEPLSADEIARRILASGYSSRSKTFTAYVCRLLRQDRRFVSNAEGLWMLRCATNCYGEGVLL